MKLKSGLSHFISSARDGLSEFKDLWKEWNVQALVITSLTLQLILIRISPFRRKTSNGVIIFAIWVSYLGADWIAAQAVGLISRDQNELSAFWAQFLLLHLGGPDTISALAVEDNNLWLRTALHLVVQAYTTLGILVRSIQTSWLWVPTILMFLAGVIKYMERVSALFCGRLTKFDQDPYRCAEDPELAKYEPGVVFVGPPAKGETEIQMVRSALYFFNYYKGLYADRQINYAMRLRSKRYFDWIKTPEDTFKVLEHQFNFTYEALYTKMKVTEMKWWKILRPIVMLFNLGSLVIWCSSHKHGIDGHDVLITYSLLIGAIFVDVLAILRIQLSYRNIANHSQGSSIRTWAYNKELLSWAYKELLSWAYNKKLVLHHRTWGRYWRKEDAPIWPWLMRAFFRRWSESVLQLNLLNLVMKKEKPTMLDKVAEFFDFKDALNAFTNGTKKWFSNHLRDFIVEDLKCKSLWVDINERKASYICYSKGSYAFLLRLSTNVQVSHEELRALLEVSKKEYVSALLHWHIITEFCYCNEIQIFDNHDGGGVEKFTLLKRLINKFKKNITNKRKSTEKDREEKVDAMEEYREICKTLSEYTMYLLLQRPTMMSTVVTGNTKQMLEDVRGKINEFPQIEIAEGRNFKDTSELDIEGSISPADNKELARKRSAYGRFCEEIEKGKEVPPPPGGRPSRSWDEFPYSLHPILKGLEALEAEEEGRERKWKFMAEVWAELVYYAAIRCRPSVHAAQLKQGGELLSYIWLLMVQLGFGLHGSEGEANQLRDQLLPSTSEQPNDP